jgi:lipopolysaccharide transport system ATP-binding protein
MSSNPSIRVAGVSKAYRSYGRAADRARQLIVDQTAFVSRMLGLKYHNRRYYREFWALQDVTFDVMPGECLGILGRNGAGKSTLLEIIAGTVAPTAGEVSTVGRIGALLELGSGFSRDFTGRENAYLNAALLGLTRSETKAKFSLIEEFADIGDYIDQPVKTYSSGMLIRLAFSVHVALDPAIMIIDEALAVGDALFQKRCYERLSQFRKNGGTILFVTHDMGLVPQLCDRAIALESGRIAAEGEPDRVTREYHKMLFGGGKGLVSNNVAGHPSARLGKEVRYGSGEAVIANLFVRDADGQRTRTLFVNQEYEFVLHVDYRRAIKERVNYGFMIGNTKGVEMYATTSGMFARSLPAGPEGTKVECVMRLKMSLMPGTYFASGALAPQFAVGDEAYLDCRFDAMDFEVVGHARSFATSAVDLGGDLRERALEVAAQDATKPSAA